MPAEELSMRRPVAPWGLLATVTLVALALTACASGSGSGAPSGTADVTVAPPASFAPTTVRLLTHDSFAVSDDVLAELAARTGVTVQVVTAGDAGELVNRAVLTAGNPEGDVLFGLDTTLLSRAVDAEVFAPYRPAALAEVSPELREIDTDDAVVPVDYGDVCVNRDDRWFADRGLVPPATLEQLADPRYRDLLVVENPATSSPGLAFLLATVARYGEEGWTGYWERLRANGVRVVNGWTEAYTGEFSGGGGRGTRPLVVSYASSPPAEIVFAADPKPSAPSTGVLTDGCYRQVEFAGVLRGTDRPEAARAVVDWLLSEPFQADVALSMFVFPARDGTALPEVFTRFAAVPPEPLALAPEVVAENRDRWVEAWTEVVLR
jgi:thiamine transport system substrate-binding protein